MKLVTVEVTLQFLVFFRKIQLNLVKCSKVENAYKTNIEGFSKKKIWAHWNLKGKEML